MLNLFVYTTTFPPARIGPEVPVKLRCTPSFCENFSHNGPHFSSSLYEDPFRPVCANSDLYLRLHTDCILMKDLNLLCDRGTFLFLKYFTFKSRINIFSPCGRRSREPCAARNPRGRERSEREQREKVAANITKGNGVLGVLLDRDWETGF